MQIKFLHRVDSALAGMLHGFLRAILDKGNMIMMTMEELVQMARETNATLRKVAGEIDGVTIANADLQASVASLQAQLDAIGVGGAVTQALIDEMVSAKANADALDAKIPDAVEVPPVEVPSVSEVTGGGTSPPADQGTGTTPG